MKPTDPVLSLTGTWLRESDKAVFFNVTAVSGSPIEVPMSGWFPFSQMLRSSKSPTPGADCIVVSEWICRQKGIEVPSTTRSSVSSDNSSVDEEQAADYSDDDLPDVDIPF